MEIGSELELDGGGDRRAHVISGSDSPRYSKRKLANALPIPVYLAPETDQGEDEQKAYESQPETEVRLHSSTDAKTNACEVKRPPTAKPTVKVLNEFLCCPICSDTCVETTTTNCGHKFCRQCIDEWRKLKPICPICSTLITSQHRLYSDDLFVESQLAYLRPDVKHRFEAAQKKRLEILMQDRKSRNVIKSVRRKLDNSLIYLRCKNSTSLSNKMRSTSQMFISKLTEWSGKSKSNIFVGIIIGAMLVVCANYYLTDSTQFLHYMWLAMKNYDGNIPTLWLNSTQAEAELPTADLSMLDSMVNGLNRILSIFT